jgi:hypothetical protein
MHGLSGARQLGTVVAAERPGTDDPDLHALTPFTACPSWSNVWCQPLPEAEATQERRL